MINDIYRRFIVKEASPRHYVFMSRVMMGVLLAISVVLSLNMTSIGAAWKFLLTFASGAGLTWIVRWFWWRANAWTEFSGMIASGIVATYLQLFYANWLYSQKLFTTVLISTVVWVTVTFLTKPAEEEKLVEFVKLVRPGSPGWNYIYRKYEIEQTPFLGGALKLWLISLVALFSLNFGVGSLLLLQWSQGMALLAISLLSFGVLLSRLKNQLIELSR